MKRLKKSLAVVLTGVLLSSLCFAPISAAEPKVDDIQPVEVEQVAEDTSNAPASRFFAPPTVTPYSAVGMVARPADDNYDVHGANAVQVVAYWFQGNTAQTEPVTISISNGGIALDEAGYEIEHTINVGRSNESTSVITNAVINGDMDSMTFTTGVNPKSMMHSVSFWVEAPLTKREFTVKVKVDNGVEFVGKNSIVIPFKVISGLTVDVVNDSGTVLTQIDDYNPFYLEGMAWYKGGDVPTPSILSLTIYNKATGQEVVEHLTVAEIINRNYKNGPLVMPSSYDDGIYEVTAHLVDLSGRFPKLLGVAMTEVNFVKLPDIFTKGIYKLNTRIGSYVDTKYDPTRFANYSFLTVDGAHRPVGGEDLGAKVILKNASNVDIAKSKFVLTTSYGDYTYGVTKSGNDVSAALYGIRAGVSPRPYVTAYIARTDGTVEEYYVGVINVVIRTDPAGVIVDGETGDLIEGALCTLRVFDPELGYVDWIDVTGEQPNPVLTTEDGKFRWDVDDGKYEVVVYHPGYHLSEYTAYSTLTDETIGEMVVPPEHLNLVLKLYNQHEPVEESN